MSSWIDYNAADQGQGRTAMGYADQEKADLARKLFHEQDIFVEKFFNGSTFVTGTGKPWS